MVFTASRSRVSTTCKAASGTAAATHPASARNAASTARQIAPVIPGAPPTASTARGVLRVADAAKRDEAQDLVAHEPVLGRQLDESDVRDDDLPGVQELEPRGARPSGRGTCSVSAARTAGPATSPVEASTPEGTSTATTGRPAALMRSISAAASGRGAPRKPVPKSASTITSAPSTSSVSSALEALLAQDPCRDPAVPPFEPPPQTTAKRRAAGNACSASRATAAPARSISSPAVAG